MACRTTDKIGSPKQQQEVKKNVDEKQQAPHSRASEGKAFEEHTAYEGKAFEESYCTLSMFAGAGLQPVSIIYSTRCSIFSQ